LNCLDGSMEATLSTGLGENKMNEICEIISFISESQFKENFGLINIDDAKKMLKIILDTLNNRAN